MVLIQVIFVDDFHSEISNLAFGFFVDGIENRKLSIKKS